MITPKEIETKEFSRAKSGGYRPEEVDSFLLYDPFQCFLS